MIVCDPNSLYHHGVLGMKWGVRRYQRKDGSLTPAGRKHLNQLKTKQSKLNTEIGKLEGHDARPQAVKDREVLKKKAKQLSNEELAQAINRIQQEQKYESLINPSKEQKSNMFIEKGKKTVTDFIWEEGKKMAVDRFESKTGLSVDPNVMDVFKQVGDVNKLTDKQYKAYQERKNYEKKEEAERARAEAETAKARKEAAESEERSRRAEEERRERERKENYNSRNIDPNNLNKASDAEIRAYKERLQNEAEIKKMMENKMK